MVTPTYPVVVPLLPCILSLNLVFFFLLLAPQNFVASNYNIFSFFLSLYFQVSLNFLNLTASLIPQIKPRYKIIANKFH